MKSILVITESIFDTQIIKLIASQFPFRCQVIQIKPEEQSKKIKKNTYAVIVINPCFDKLPSKEWLTKNFAGPTLYLLSEKNKTIKNYILKPLDENSLKLALLKCIQKSR